ncbi:MAG: hypothetical protein Q8M16_06585 [Pirellulaceae bacterium]|nr:hypothetical protein [Pirellulaceae bacterium]
MFRSRTVSFNRWSGIAGCLVLWTSLCPSALAQFHQTQWGQGAPVAPTIPGQFQSNPAVGSPDGPRSDSTVTGVRSLINLPMNPAFGAQNQGYFPTSVPTSGTGETQQGTGIPALPGRIGTSQEQWQGNWQGSTNPLLNSNPAASSQGSPSVVGQPGWIPPLPQNTGFNSGSTLTQQPGGEMTAPANRLLAIDQTQRQRSNPSVAQRQAEVGNWDRFINLPTMTSQGLRKGRATAGGQDGFSESMYASQGSAFLSENSDIPTAKQVANTGQDLSGGTEQSTVGSKPKASMDALSWWLMMCSVMANLILFYFLYDSRAKYLNLADELQSRFFREG